MATTDRFYFSPDAGHLVERGNHYYTEYGHVLSSRATIRMMPINSCENYADWSDKKRREVREQFEAEAKKQEADEQRRRKQRDALVKKARSKLTPAEFDAVYMLGVADERGY